MRLYLNDASIQEQFQNFQDFLDIFQRLLILKNRYKYLNESFHITRSLSNRKIGNDMTLRQVLMMSGQREFRSALILWLDRNGPFMDDDRLAEENDYFECLGIDVTNSGLGEATRRIKFGWDALSFSIHGGQINFAISPLSVRHGLEEEPYGDYSVNNIHTFDVLETLADSARQKPTNWSELITTARENYSLLNIPDYVYTNPLLAREPFDSVISDRFLNLLNYLNQYMAGRRDDGAEGPESQEIVRKFFNGDRALFSGESITNQRNFAADLTFADPDDEQKTIFAHWHGKISHRFFRLHFEWPVPANAKQLKIVYLGPKITKN